MSLLRMTRRRFLGLVGGTVAAGAGAYGYTRWIEPHWLDVVRREMPIPNLPDALVGRRLAHISDLHVGSTDAGHLAECLRVVTGLKPDLLAITGDFMTCERFEQVDRVPQALAQLRIPPLGCFAVLGNHDYGTRWRRFEVADRLANRLNGCGVQLLRNTSRQVAGLTLLGVDDQWAGRCLPARAVLNLDPSQPAVALCHNPDSVDEPGWEGFRGWMLAGHTHGGQCKAPLLPPPILNLRNRRYSSGEFDLGDGRRLYVNRGLGYVRKLRFNSRPEVTLFRLQRANYQPAGVPQMPGVTSSTRFPAGSRK